jgi:hypothetical protein
MPSGCLCHLHCHIAIGLLLMLRPQFQHNNRILLLQFPACSVIAIFRLLQLSLYPCPAAHLLNLYVSFSAMSLSPMSKVGYMDSEGMKRGSAMNLAADNRQQQQ